MANRNLTLDEFWKLSPEKRREQYRDLSEQDRFRVRLSMNPGFKRAPCNDCVHYFGYAKCAAYPDGISSEHMAEIEKDVSVPCGSSFRFQEKQHTRWQKTKPRPGRWCK